MRMNLILFFHFSKFLFLSDLLNCLHIGSLLCMYIAAKGAMAGLTIHKFYGIIFRFCSKVISTSVTDWTENNANSLNFVSDFHPQHWWETFGFYDIDMNPRHLHPLLIITEFCILFIWNYSVAALKRNINCRSTVFFFIHLNHSLAQYTSFYELRNLLDRLWFESHFHYAHLLRLGVCVYELFFLHQIEWHTEKRWSFDWDMCSCRVLFFIIYCIHLFVGGCCSTN